MNIKTEAPVNEEKNGTGVVRQKIIKQDYKRNDRKINLKERGARHAGSKKGKETTSTKSDDLI